MSYRRVIVSRDRACIVHLRPQDEAIPIAPPPMVVVENSSGKRLARLFISTNPGASWGPNRVPSDYKGEPWMWLSFTTTDCPMIDVHAEFQDGSTETQKRFSVCEGVILKGTGTPPAAAVAPGQFLDVGIWNSSQNDWTHLYVSSVFTSNWGQDRLRVQAANRGVMNLLRLKSCRCSTRSVDARGSSTVTTPPRSRTSTT